MRRRLTILAGAACLAILAALAIVLSSTDHRRTSTDDRLLQAGAPIPPGQSACQPGETIGAGTGGALFFVDGAGPLEVTVLTKAGRVTRGVVAAGSHSRWYVTPVRLRPAVKRAIPSSSVCVTNRGRSTVKLYGQAFDKGEGTAKLPTTVPQPLWIGVRFDFFTDKPVSWWSYAGTVADRHGYVKASFFGSWTLWAVLAALVALCLGTVMWAGRALAR